jgi:Skp family chaperone for outer membrane proteins
VKYLVKFFVVTLFLIFCTAVTAEQDIVVLDLQYVLNNSKAGKGAQDFLKKSFKDSTQKYSDMEKALKKEEQDLLTKKTVLSKEEYVKKSDALRKKVIDYQSQRRASIDKIATLRIESRQKLIDAIDPILEIYIKGNNISLVIDKKNTLGGNPETDITKIITEKLDKILPSLNLK